jgi:uncharacterized protein YegL
LQKKQLVGAICERSINSRIFCLETKPIYDLLFILDGSSSSTQQKFKLSKMFIKDVIDSLDIDETSTRVSLIEYSDRATLEFPLNEYFDKGGLKGAVDNVRASGGSGTVTGEALQLAVNQVFTRTGGDRPGVPNAIILVTDGKSTGSVSLSSAARPLKQAGTDMYVISVGPATDKQELQNLTTGEDRFYVVKNEYGLVRLPARLVRNMLRNSQKGECA